MLAIEGAGVGLELLLGDGGEDGLEQVRRDVTALGGDAEMREGQK